MMNPKSLISPAALRDKVPMFKNLSDTELGRLAAGTHEIRAECSDILFHKGDSCNGIYLILDGRVKLALTSAQGNEKIIEILNPGDSFGESTMLLGQVHQAYAQTLSDCVLLHIAKSAILAELDQGPPFARQLIDGLAQRLAMLTADIESQLLHTGRQRVIHYLLREVEGNNCSFEPGHNSPRITFTTNKGIVASRLNLTHEHFSRVLHDLTSHGLIAVNRRNVQIHDLSKLRGSAN